MCVDLIEVLKSARNIGDIDCYRDDILAMIPLVEIMIGFDQQNKAHQYDLWEHSLHTVVNLPKDMDDDMLYLAAFLHDIGKPDCQVSDEKDPTFMHYYGHPKRSMEIVRDDIIPRLLGIPDGLSADECRRLLYYIENHDDGVSLRMKSLRRHLRKGASLQEFKNLMWLQIADAKAHVMLPVIEEKIHICEQWLDGYSEKMYKDILSGK